MATITGTDGNDNLTGTAGSDEINSLLGKDTVDGLGDSDTLIVDYSHASVDPFAGATPANVPSKVNSGGGTFSGSIKTVDGFNYVTFSNVEHLQVKLDFWHNTFILDGGALALGATISLDGGTGTDTLEADLTDLASVDLVLDANGIAASFGTIISFEAFRLKLTAGDDHVTTGAANDSLTGNSGDDVLDSGGGQDILDGGRGSNTLNAGAGDDQIFSAGVDTVDGGTGFDRWTGNYGSSTANLNFVRDTAAGTATMSNGTSLTGVERILALTTGSGDDVFTFTTPEPYDDGFLLAAGTGEDSLTFSGNAGLGVISADGADAFGGTLGNDRFGGIEHLTFVSRGLSDTISVDAAPLGAGATLSMDGAAGVDTLVLDFTALDGITFTVAAGGAGTSDVGLTTANFEFYEIDAGAGDDTITTGSGNDRVQANGGDDVVATSGGNDQLDGGGGADTMRGGSGDDTYIADNAGDLVQELAGEGVDEVRTALAKYTLGANVDNVTGLGTGNQTFFGNSLANRISGGAGADSMRGGSGNDTYVVDNSGDRTLEFAGEGTDTVESSLAHTLLANLENLVLTGTANVNGAGNALNNVIDGNAGRNLINGLGGADTMRGGLGHDIYIVDNVGDQVIEIADGGTDTVQSSVNFTLGANVERLYLTGSGNVNGFGNTLANAINGNSGANRLDGRAGADTMLGGLGNDIYVVDNAGDVAIESSAAGGIDTVESSVALTLLANVENLILTGSANINGAGNGLVNSLTGNGGNNLLNGFGGADTMRGGFGDDVYIVDNVGDQALETSATGGDDRVQSSVSFGLASFVEQLTLTGSASINGTGNALDNVINGNNGANNLGGLSGNDTLRGGAGNDALHGGTGNDTLDGGANADGFYFETALDAATNIDTILGYVVADDTIFLDNAVFTGLADGALAAGAFNTGSAAIDADDRIIYNSVTGALLFDADGVGGAAAVQFATVTAGLAMSASEFTVI